MPIIPTIRCRRMAASTAFDTEARDFEYVNDVDDPDGNTLRFTQPLTPGKP